jgi:hypothetical protein
MSSGSNTTASPSSNFGAPTPLSRLSIWAYLAIAFVILVLAAMVSYMIYACYYTAGLRARLKAEADEGVGAGAGGVKGGWQNLEDPSGETVVERGEGRLTKGRDVEEKVDVDYRDEHKTDGIIHPWSEKNRSGLKGLGIQLERKPQVTLLYLSLSTILTFKNPLSSILLRSLTNPKPLFYLEVLIVLSVLAVLAIMNTNKISSRPKAPIVLP